MARHLIAMVALLVMVTSYFGQVKENGMDRITSVDDLLYAVRILERNCCLLAVFVCRAWLQSLAKLVLER